MTQLLVAVGIVALALTVAAVVRRRRPDPPSQPRFAGQVPAQLDRADFPRPDAPWLVVVFTSATCDTCALVREKAFVLESDDVAVTDAEYATQRSLHRRYGIDAVPMLVVVDGAGVVRRSFVGPVTATDLWACLAELRDDQSRDSD